MVAHSEIDSISLRSRIRKKEITVGGNRKMKIYGTLNCSSGKRMRNQNRVFFTNEQEALAHGYRPCGNCMKSNYQNWKNGTVS